jgi:hypothetical protein
VVTFPVMRGDASRQSVLEFLERLGQRVRGPAVLQGWRASTIDIDLKLDPEPPGVFEAIRDLKDELQLNVELAPAKQFLPPLPGWLDRSIWIGRFGSIDALHYDFYSQALAKIQRGHTQDMLDVKAMLGAGSSWSRSNCERSPMRSRPD